MTAPGATPLRPVVYRGGRLRILDQTALPAEERWIEAEDVETVAAAIRSLAVRGAPLLGITAAHGVAVAARASSARTVPALLEDLTRAAEALARSRPTAVNVRWAVDRVVDAARVEARTLGGEAGGGDVGAAAVSPGNEAAAVERLTRAVEVEAARIAKEDEEACLRIGAFGSDLVRAGANVLTHCNTGALATGGIGTALGVVVAARGRGKDVHVWVDETRPVLQGSRLTAWELRRLGIPMTLIADTAAASLMALGSVDLVLVGADRIAANGDVANKVGTYALAVLARHHAIPFVVAAPTSTVDLATPTGGDIVIERRDADEVLRPLGIAIAPEGTQAFNPAFDVTPASLVTSIVTERGVAEPPYERTLRELLAGAGSGPALGAEPARR